MALSTTHCALLSVAHPQQLLGSSSSSKVAVLAVGVVKRRSVGAGLVVRALLGGDDGGFGARDPFPGS